MSYYENKTESPTKKKIRKAKKSGMNIYSKKLNSLFLFCIFFLILSLFQKKFFLDLINIIRFSLIFDQNITENNFQEIFNIFKYCCRESLNILFIIFFFIILSVFFSPTISRNFSYNIRMINFDTRRLNIFLGIKKIFSASIFVKFLKIFSSIFMLFLFLIFYFSNNFIKIFSIMYKNYVFSFMEGMKIIFELHYLFLIFLLPIVFFDILLKNYLYNKKLRMSHQELRDEFKNLEGNPQIKSKMREKMKFLIKKKSILEIQKSDVIITKFKKYAIILKYDENNMIAPKIIFKGSKYLFSKILKLGKKYNILFLDFPLLAKMLYKHGEIGKYIPYEFYESVADVFAWLWKLQEWKKKGGEYPKFQKKIHKLLNINVLGKNK
ncbi:Flagellar biosynthetic protein FlhB [Buchnera aphidicola (Sipha maydis)]|uniref:EscU/YscU/HrcU family type III secretion system export apparatus switch protein n=1 Tax=Buchnera aphidicola TaxID=9 RepID=UPI0034642AEF